MTTPRCQFRRCLHTRTLSTKPGLTVNANDTIVTGTNHAQHRQRLHTVIVHQPHVNSFIVLRSQSLRSAGVLLPCISVLLPCISSLSPLTSIGRPRHCFRNPRDCLSKAPLQHRLKDACTGQSAQRSLVERMLAATKHRRKDACTCQSAQRTLQEFHSIQS